MLEKRIIKEITRLKNSTSLKDNHIYVNVSVCENEKIISKKYNIRALLIGPKDTPYHNGFFFFNIFLPNDYPMSPPTFKFKTLDKKRIIRFNPNLYTDGKVCLSIINTWHGPTWSPCNTIESVLLSIQALVFTNNPLVNEPGFEKSSKMELENYNNIIKYGTMQVATCDMLNKTPRGFKYFNKIIKSHFYKNIEWYRDNLTMLKIKHGSYCILNDDVYDMTVEINYDKLIYDFEYLYDINQTCNGIYKSGAKKGQKCGRTAKYNGFCGSHKVKEIKEAKKIKEVKEIKKVNDIVINS